MIPLSVPYFSGNEWKYVKECIDTGWVSSAGKYVETFEERVAEYVGAKYAVACVNGTAALHIALEIVGVRPGDEVIVPTVTFIASVNAVRYVGAEPIFMDCDNFYCMDVEKVVDFLREKTRFREGYCYNKISGRRISAIVPVHVFGNAVNLEPLVEMCQERNIKVVEDAAESLGTFYSVGKLSGKSTGIIGDIGILSFNGNKIITTGGGGMIVTNRKTYAERAKYLTTQAKDDPVRYIHNEVGYNFRLTNLQAALGVAQLEKLGEYIEKKRENYMLYKKEVDSIPGLHIAETPEYCSPNYWFYCLRVKEKEYGMSKDKLLTVFTERKIQVRPIWYLSHWQRPYRSCQCYKIERAVKLYEETLNIPCSVNLSQEQRERVLEVLRDGRR